MRPSKVNALDPEIRNVMDSISLGDIAAHPESDIEAESESLNTAVFDPVISDEVGTVSQELGDVGLWPTIISDNLRKMLVQQVSRPAQNLNGHFPRTFGPGQSTKGGGRTLTKNWLYRKLQNGKKILQTWMVYSPTKNSIFCFCCKLFAVSNGNTSVFASEDSLHKWWTLNPKVGYHESSVLHVECFAKWKTLEVALQC